VRDSVLRPRPGKNVASDPPCHFSPASRELDRAIERFSFDSCLLVSDLAMSANFCKIASFARSTIHEELARSGSTPDIWRSGVVRKPTQNRAPRTHINIRWHFIESQTSEIGSFLTRVPLTEQSQLFRHSVFQSHFVWTRMKIQLALKTTSPNDPAGCAPKGEKQLASTRELRKGHRRNRRDNQSN
jgi:hypothetical protein